MIKNYIIVALRHLKRQPAYSLLNILGLTIGIVSSLLIVLYLSNELGYDKQHSKGDRLYRINADITEPDDNFRWSTTQLPLAKTVAADLDEVESYVTIANNGRVQFKEGENTYLEEGIFLADSTLFDLFDYEILAGNPRNALTEPNTIVLSKSLADKIFKEEDPMGKMLKTEGASYKITGVYNDVAKQSHIKPRGIISLATYPDRNNPNYWGGFGMYSYILLREDADPEAVEAKLEGIVDKYVAIIFDQFDIKIKYELLNVRDIHLYSDYESEPEPLGNIKYIYIFSAVAFFLIILASINYMNLSTARSMRRSLEVGVRKVMGAYRSGLIKQFMAESLLITVFSLIISILLLLILVPLLNSQLGTMLDVNDLLNPLTIAVILGILLITSVLSGSYPAFYLSSFKPAVVLKGKNVSGAGNKFLRRFLVGSQFALSIFMLLSTLIIYNQMNFLQNAEMGFDKQQMVSISLNEQQTRNKWPIFKNKILQNNSIESASTSQSVPGRGFGKNVMAVETSSGTMEDYGIDLFRVDYDYFETLNIEIMQGRNFSTDYVTDTASAVIVNESMIARMNWENPIGKKFRFPSDSSRTYKVIGIAKDYHHRSLYNPIEAMLFIPAFNNEIALVKVTGDTKEAINMLNVAWNETFPGTPFEYTFLDQQFMEQYETDQLRGKLVLGFSVMMILIACLGLLGLASFIAEQKSKEISIRKVLGAETGGLVGLLIKDFVVLVLLGAIPAFIAGFLIMKNWLKNFEYHVEINVLHFLIVLIAILFVTVITTGYHALKAATSDPAKSLKAE
ncbi:MAG: ABC transporter permease [Cyclobacteriaceae bacterium]